MWDLSHWIREQLNATWSSCRWGRDWQLLAGLQGLTFQNNFEGIKPQLKPKQRRTALNYVWMSDMLYVNNLTSKVFSVEPKSFFFNVGATQEKPQPADRSKFHRKVNHIVLFLKQWPHTCGFVRPQRSCWESTFLAKDCNRPFITKRLLLVIRRRAQIS